jgi:hypothetical protein
VGDVAARNAYDLLQSAAEGLIGVDHRLLHALVDNPSETLPDVVKFAQEDHSSDPVDLTHDLIAIFEHLRRPEALPFLIGQLRARVHQDADDLIGVFLGIGAPAVDPLLGLYEELGEEEAGDVAYLLAGLRVQDERILKLLLERFEYDAVDGSFLLGLYGDPAARPVIEAALQETNDPELKREFQFAIEHFEAPQLEPVVEPIDLWSMYPEKAPPAAELLDTGQRLLLLKEGNEEQRIAAATSFVNEDYPDSVRDALLDRARNDESLEVRSWSWQALMSVADEPAIKAALLGKISDRESPIEERAGATVALALDASEPAIRTSIVELYQKPETRVKALEAMWRSLDRDFSDVLPKHLEDPDPAVRRQAILGTGYLGIGAEAGRLRAMFDDEDYRTDALFAYALCVPAEISRGRIRGLIRKIEDAAGGLSPTELQIVEVAVNDRLALHGHNPVFRAAPADDELEEYPAPSDRKTPGRNDPCPCGSGKKYKKCCGAA